MQKIISISLVLFFLFGAGLTKELNNSSKFIEENSPSDSIITDKLKKEELQKLEYARCLQMKDLTMYGTVWCPHCKRQKELLGKYLQYIKVVDCDRQKDLCRQKGIRGYPTLLLPNDQEIPTGTLEEIARATECMPRETNPYSLPRNQK